MCVVQNVDAGMGNDEGGRDLRDEPRAWRRALRRQEETSAIGEKVNTGRIEMMRSNIPSGVRVVLGADVGSDS